MPLCQETSRRFSSTFANDFASLSLMKRLSQDWGRDDVWQASSGCKWVREGSCGDVPVNRWLWHWFFQDFAKMAPSTLANRDFRVSFSDEKSTNCARRDFGSMLISGSSFKSHNIRPLNAKWPTCYIPEK